MNFEVVFIGERVEDKDSRYADCMQCHYSLEYSQEVCDYEADHDAVGEDVTVLLEEYVECLKLRKAPQNVEHRSVPSGLQVRK